MDLIYWNFLTINKKQNINVFPPYFFLEIKMVLIISFHPYCQRNSGIWKKNAHHWWMFMFIHVNSFTSFVIYKSRIHCKPGWLAGLFVCLFYLSPLNVMALKPLSWIVHTVIQIYTRNTIQTRIIIIYSALVAYIHEI